MKMNWTSRRIEIVTLLARGATAEMIGDRLGIATKTVKNTLATIYDEFGVLNAPHCVAKALANNIIPNPVKPDMAPKAAVPKEGDA